MELADDIEVTNCTFWMDFGICTPLLFAMDIVFACIAVGADTFQLKYLKKYKIYTIYSAFFHAQKGVYCERTNFSKKKCTKKGKNGKKRCKKKLGGMYIPFLKYLFSFPALRLWEEISLFWWFPLRKYTQSEYTHSECTFSSYADVKLMFKIKTLNTHFLNFPRKGGNFPKKSVLQESQFQKNLNLLKSQFTEKCQFPEKVKFPEKSQFPKHNSIP